MKKIGLIVSVLLFSVFASAVGSSGKGEGKAPKTPMEFAEGIKLRLNNLGVSSQIDSASLERLAKAQGDKQTFSTIKRFYEALDTAAVRKNLEDANLKRVYEEMLENVAGSIRMAADITAQLENNSLRRIEGGKEVSGLGPNGKILLDAMKAALGMAREALEGGATVKTDTAMLNIARTLGKVTPEILKNEDLAAIEIAKIEAELNGYKIGQFILDCNK